MIHLCCVEPSGMRRLSCIKHAEVDYLGALSDGGDVALALPRDALETCFIRPGLVATVVDLRRKPKVSPSVVVSFSIDVVDLKIRPLTCHYQPRDPVSRIRSVVELELEIPVIVTSARCRACYSPAIHCGPPPQCASFGVVTEKFGGLLVSQHTRSSNSTRPRVSGRRNPLRCSRGASLPPRPLRHITPQA